CATSSAPGANSWRHERGGALPLRAARSAADRREALRRVVRAFHRRRVLLGAARARAEGSARAQLARLRGQAAPQAAHRAAEAAQRVLAEARESLPARDADTRGGEVRTGPRGIPDPDAVCLYRDARRRVTALRGDGLAHPR